MFTDSAIWILQTVFTVYLIILWLRILLPTTNTSPINPVSQLVMSLTNCLVNPLQRILPKHVKFDYVGLIILLLVQIVELYIVGYLQTGEFLNFGAILLWTVGQTLNLLVAIFIWSIVIEVIFSWLAILRQRYYAIQDVLLHLTDPVLKPIRWIIPPMGPFDFSPLLGLLIMVAIERYLVGPLVQYAIILAFNASIGI
jgi:YggT family protein